MPTIPLNGEPPLGYRIGTSDRILGDAATEPEGFYVLNQTSGAAFQVSGGVWITATFPAYLYAAWLATITTVTPGAYRIGTSDRTIGATSNAPENFFVVNSCNSKVFQVQSGLWADVTSTFNSTELTNIIAAWLNA